MGGTTYSAIRQAQLEVLRELVMTGLPGEPLLLREEDNHPDFVAWAEAGGGPLRRFDVAHGFDFGEERYLDEQTSLELHTSQVMVSYPAVRHLVAGDERIELEDLIEQDLEDIDRALGARGVAGYAELAHGLHLCRLERAELVERAAARVLRLVFSLDYDRTMGELEVAANVAPTAEFTHIATDLSVAFTDTSSDSDGTIASWLWDFGDGNTSTQQNPVHAYATSGDYAVTLAVTDDDGATDDVQHTVSPSARLTIAPTVLTSGSSTTDGASVATASIASPPAATPIYVGVFHGSSTSATQPTCTGLGLAWSVVLSVPFSGGRRITVFEAIGAPTPGALTFDFGGVTQSSFAWSVIAMSGGALASFTAQSTSGAPVGLVMTANATFAGAKEHAHSVALYFVGHSVNEGTTPDAQFAELTDNTIGSGQLGLEAAWSVTEVTADPTWATATGGAIIMLECKAGLA